MYPDSLKNLIESFKMLPGVGEKTAERMAFFLLNEDQERTNFFANSITIAKEKIRKCEVCNGITDKEICDINNILASTKRKHNCTCQDILFYALTFFIRDMIFSLLERTFSTDTSWLMISMILARYLLMLAST